MEDLLGKMQELLSDPESMKQISELAQMFKSDEAGQTEAIPQEMPLDTGMLLKASEMFSQQKSDKNTELLTALRPHLRQERQIRLDKAIRFLKLWNLWKQMKETGMLQNLF